MSAPLRLSVFVDNRAGRKGVPIARSFERWVRAALADTPARPCRSQHRAARRARGARSQSQVSRQGLRDERAELSVRTAAGRTLGAARRPRDLSRGRRARSARTGQAAARSLRAPDRARRAAPARPRSRNASATRRRWKRSSGACWSEFGIRRSLRADRASPGDKSRCRARRVSATPCSRKQISCNNRFDKLPPRPFRAFATRK